jgi:hypothetical protein
MGDCEEKMNFCPVCGNFWGEVEEYGIKKCGFCTKRRGICAKEGIHDAS